MHAPDAATTSVIVLAGGSGTRVSSVTRDTISKVMLPVNGKPFLEFVLRLLRSNGFRHCVLAVGHRAESIKSYFGEGQGVGLALDYCVESKPRGTGGAVLLAFPLATSPTVLIVNGDTFFDIDYLGFLGIHDQLGGTATLALTHVANENRFGVVRVRDDGVVDGFVEKGTTTGLISGGVYAANRNTLQHALGRLSRKNLSLEEQVWPLLAELGQLRAVTMSGSFLDMGTPEAYGLAGEALRQHDW